MEYAFPLFFLPSFLPRHVVNTEHHMPGQLYVGFWGSMIPAHEEIII